MGTALLFASVQSMRRAVSSLNSAPSIGRGVVGDSTLGPVDGHDGS